MLIKSVCLLSGIIFQSTFLFQNILAVEEDEFYCRSESDNLYKSACKRCINDEDCDYEYELSNFKSCHCSDLELLNNDGGKHYATITHGWSEGQNLNRVETRN